MLVGGFLSAASAAGHAQPARQPPPPAAPQSVQAPDAAAQPPATVNAFGTQVVLPSTAPELIGEVTKRNAEIRTMLDQGQLGTVWFPAITAKDAALALEKFNDRLTADGRAHADDAVRRLVLSAWQMDTYGDLGDKERLTAAYTVFAGAVTDLTSAYGAIR
jgi:hypothetical protein